MDSGEKKEKCISYKAPPQKNAMYSACCGPHKLYIYCSYDCEYMFMLVTRGL